MLTSLASKVLLHLSMALHAGYHTRANHHVTPLATAVCPLLVNILVIAAVRAAADLSCG